MRLVSILFPGQEPQNISTLSYFINKHSIIKNTFDESSEYIGCNLRKLIQKSSDTMINKSKYSKLIMLTLSISIYRLWKNNNKRDLLILAGHSLGEYSALVCSESLKFQDAIKLVILRDKFMKKCMGKKKGAMHAIIGLSELDIQKILNNIKNSENVSIACINTKYQIVISGEESIVFKISNICKKSGAKKIFRLSITPPSHCTLMKKASKKLSEVLNTIPFKKPIFPVINNVDAQCETSELNIKNALSRQLFCPVKWMDCIIYLSKKTSIFFEAGLNNTLINLNKFIIKTPSTSLNIKTNIIP